MGAKSKPSTLSMKLKSHYMIVYNPGTDRVADSLDPTRRVAFSTEYGILYICFRYGMDRAVARDLKGNH